jgi:hypothetical protein
MNRKYRCEFLLFNILLFYMCPSFKQDYPTFLVSLKLAPLPPTHSLADIGKASTYHHTELRKSKGEEMM